MSKRFKDLSEQELLALAITAEEEDGKIYREFAKGLEREFPSTAQLFRDMAAEELEHQNGLTELYHQKFGDHIPVIRRSDVSGFVRRKPVWLIRPLGLKLVRQYAGSMEVETRRFYQRAAGRAKDPAVSSLLTRLADAEAQHIDLAEKLSEKHLGIDARSKEDEASRRLFMLQIVQPGLAGLMDGSVSTLAPLFAAAFATQVSGTAFRVGLAASVGAGISMAFAEALSDDGTLTGRGKPLLRGFVCGLMTTAGGIGHTLPFLIPNFHLATSVACVVVAFELLVISYIRKRYMDTRFLSAAFQVIVGGVLVFLAGIFIGKAG